MSAVGTTLLQSPGWNEGKARYETLGKHIQNEKELRRGAAHPSGQMFHRIQNIVMPIKMIIKQAP